MAKEILFKLTEKDFEFTASRGSGPGGQKRNKTSTKVQCLHRPSGAMGVSDETRSQHQNKRLAFEKMAKSDKFQKWARLEAARVTGQLNDIEEKIDYDLKHNVKVERQVNGKWEEWKDYNTEPK